MSILSSDLIIRSEKIEDYYGISIVHNQAFFKPDEAELVERIRASNFYSSALALVAEYQGQIIGHILLSYLNLVGEETIPVLGLAPLAVLPELQNQGVGSQWGKVALEKADEIKEPLVIVLGHPEFYLKFGLEPCQNYHLKSLIPFPPEALRVKRLKSYPEKYRGEVVYPFSFAACF